MERSYSYQSISLRRLVEPRLGRMLANCQIGTVQRCSHCRPDAVDGEISHAAVVIERARASHAGLARQTKRNADVVRGAGARRLDTGRAEQ